MTPCIKECCYVKEFDCCVSCGRTLNDLTVWSKLTNPEQRYRMALAKTRLEELKQKGEVVDI